MTDTEQLEETEKQQYSEFRRKLNMQAAEAQIAKLEYEVTDAATTDATIRGACQVANNLKLGAICVLPNLVRPCANLLGSNPQTSLIACISFPHGGDTMDSKASAVKNAVKDGVDEVEVTAPIAYVKVGNWGYVKREFRLLKRAAKKRALRINIECDLLTPPEIAKLSSVAADCGVPSIRLSSGAYGGVFNAETITTVKNAVKDKCTVKVACINTFGEMQTAINMGAGIIGSKNAPDIANLILQASKE